jgi:hypothetical protein
VNGQENDLRGGPFSRSLPSSITSNATLRVSGVSILHVACAPAIQTLQSCSAKDRRFYYRSYGRVNEVIDPRTMKRPISGGDQSESRDFELQAKITESGYKCHNLVNYTQATMRHTLSLRWETWEGYVPTIYAHWSSIPVSIVGSPRPLPQIISRISLLC